MPKYIYDEIKSTLFSDHPNTVHKINTTFKIYDDSNGYEQYYG